MSQPPPHGEARAPGETGEEGFPVLQKAQDLLKGDPRARVSPRFAEAFGRTPSGPGEVWDH